MLYLARLIPVSSLRTLLSWAPRLGVSHGKMVVWRKITMRTFFSIIYNFSRTAWRICNFASHKVRHNFSASYLFKSNLPQFGLFHLLAQIFASNLRTLKINHVASSRFEETLQTITSKIVVSIKWAKIRHHSASLGNLSLIVASERRYISRELQTHILMLLSINPSVKIIHSNFFDLFQQYYSYGILPFNAICKVLWSSKD